VRLDLGPHRAPASLASVVVRAEVPLLGHVGDGDDLAGVLLREGAAVGPSLAPHADLIASIKAGKPLNEGRQVAESCLTAIMGRMSAYTGRALSWDWVMNASKLELGPTQLEFGDLPPLEVPIPGQTPLV